MGRAGRQAFTPLWHFKFVRPTYLNHEALNKRHHTPNIQKRQKREVKSPEQRKRNAQNRRQQPVTPIFTDRVSFITGAPNSAETVNSIRLGNNILEIDLQVSVNVGRVSINVLQAIDLLVPHIFFKFVGFDAFELVADGACQVGEFVFDVWFWLSLGFLL